MANGFVILISKRVIQMATKNIQIPEDLFFDILQYFDLLEDEKIDDPDYRDFLKDRIIEGLSDKIEKIQKRQLYAQQFDKTLTPEEKEKARQLYLDKIGMHQDWRW